ncbi:MAG: FAD-dependent oxidoreductase, partial [bacterium]|nr:FAD-dependent oxidoreductase [bacterium]
VTTNHEENIKKALAKKLRIDEKQINNFSIKKQSLDARKKEEIFYVYEVDVSLHNEKDILKKNHSNDIQVSPNEEYIFQVTGTKKMKNRPVIVGSGPAGLICAYLLAEHGYQPFIIERGEKVEARIKTVKEFWETGKLNPESNVQFGEGGAGTFSDGKLNTLVNDKNYRGKKTFEIFVECGAPKEILYSYKPHIGTDILIDVIRNMRKKIIAMGGEFLYSTCLTDLVIENDTLKEIEVNHREKIPCDCLVLAIGHSSRDTFQMLLKNQVNMEAKPFAVGVRVQHSQDMINESQYGNKYKDLLGSANYKLTYKASNGRGVYSFCMCPGGYVVNASSEENRLAINGMSYHNRDSKNANSAIIVTVFPRDFGANPLDGVEYQKRLEEKAYKIGNGKIPVQLLKDFKENKNSTSFGKVEPIMKGNYQFSNLNDLLPNEMNDSLKEAFPYFGKKIHGFDDEDTILAGIESRTSSPVRIIRNDSLEANIEGIYPCGEGAGYAGGITSASIDGIKVFEAIAGKFNGSAFEEKEG